jgi:uncharacterized small protein (DUF1192 family)
MHRNEFRGYLRVFFVFLSGLMVPPCVYGQASAGTPGAGDGDAENSAENGSRADYVMRELDAMKQRIAVLEAEVSRLKAHDTATAAAEPAPAPAAPAPAAPVEARTGEGNASVSNAASPQAGETRGTFGLPTGTTVNLTIDGYYEYNFNHPVGRVNLLRAYDVSSNSFSLNQASIILDRAPDPEAGRRFGARLDLQFGQATETLQGSAANELRPQVYRNVFQAYGTYVAPVGSGLTIDFGKWASSLGYENNYTKDQWNYSRSYLFDFLPFYHMGVRASYSITPAVSASYWLVNGAQQAEDFNGAKSQALILTLKPLKTVVWNVNYYTGQEQPDVVAVLNPGLPTGPTQPGLPVTPVSPAPNGRLHIVDSYGTWTATSRLSLAGEADYVVNRVFSNSAPGHDTAGALYARYQFTRQFGLAARGEYLSDRGALFSGVSQALKEATFTADYRILDGFLARWEWRRDFSNRPFFLTSTPGVLSREQETATLGLVWWWGEKQGAW